MRIDLHSHSRVSDGTDAPADLEYDLAHEVTGDETEHVPPPHPPVYVATQTLDYDGDYGYDMAHDVPGR